VQGEVLTGAGVNGFWFRSGSCADQKHLPVGGGSRTKEIHVGLGGCKQEAP
jgi:hypothetical protein